MDCRGVRVLHSQVECHLGELNGRTVRRGQGEVTPGLRFCGAEDISRAASFIFRCPVWLPGPVPPRKAAALPRGG
jgi:hypothetical protein